MIARYTLPEMGAVWTEQTRYELWLAVELAVASVQADMGIIPRRAYARMRTSARVDAKRIARIEAEVHHDVIAFTTQVMESIGVAGKYLHFGLTSSDVVDTALSLQILRAAELIDARLATTLKVLRRLAQKYKRVPCIGRTHGVMAEPTTVGLKFALWYADLNRARTRLRAARNEMAYGKLSGAVGNYANLSPQVEKRALKRLGLAPAPVSTQVLQRDRHASFVAAIALLMSSLEKCATEIRNLQRTEIGEMFEPFGERQKGSSAMPHKRNPILSERITGLARLARGYALSAMENIPLWHERDIAHSSVERVILPDCTIIADYALSMFTKVLEGLTIDRRRMRENLNFAGGLVFSQRLLLKLTPAAGSRDIAYRLVQRHALRALDERSSFRNAVVHDEQIRGYLTPEEIAACFELDPYLAHVDTIFKRVFGK